MGKNVANRFSDEFARRVMTHYATTKDSYVKTAYRFGINRSTVAKMVTRQNYKDIVLPQRITDMMADKEIKGRRRRTSEAAIRNMAFDYINSPYSQAEAAEKAGISATAWRNRMDHLSKFDLDLWARVRERAKNWKQVTRDGGLWNPNIEEGKTKGRVMLYINNLEYIGFWNAREGYWDGHYAMLYGDAMAKHNKPIAWKYLPAKPTFVKKSSG